MTSAILDRPGLRCTHARGDASGPAARLGGHVTLEELLSAALRAARTSGSTECPVCDGRMTSTRAGAECAGCGCRLT